MIEMNDISSFSLCVSTSIGVSSHYTHTRQHHTSYCTTHKRLPILLDNERCTNSNNKHERNTFHFLPSLLSSVERHDRVCVVEGYHTTGSILSTLHHPANSRRSNTILPRPSPLSNKLQHLPTSLRPSICLPKRRRRPLLDLL